MNEYGLCDQAGTNRDVATVDATTNRINKLLFKVASFFYLYHFTQLLLFNDCMLFIIKLVCNPFTQNAG
jgi:hypothetical protein